jgi:hypothetical protein
MQALIILDMQPIQNSCHRKIKQLRCAYPISYEAKSGCLRNPEPLFVCLVPVTIAFTLNRLLRLASQ